MLNARRLFRRGIFARHLGLALLFALAAPEGRTTSAVSVPAEYIVNVHVHQGGADFVVHAIETYSAKAHIQCVQELNSVQCRRDGKTLMMARVDYNDISIVVYINPPPAVEEVLSQVISAAKADPGAVSAVSAWGPHVPPTIKSLTGG